MGTRMVKVALFHVVTTKCLDIGVHACLRERERERVICMHGKNALPGPLTEGNKLGYGQAGKKECTKFIISRICFMYTIKTNITS